MPEFFCQAVCQIATREEGHIEWLICRLGGQAESRDSEVV